MSLAFVVVYTISGRFPARIANVPPAVIGVFTARGDPARSAAVLFVRRSNRVTVRVAARVDAVESTLALARINHVPAESMTRLGLMVPKTHSAAALVKV
jgi:hypothetical protein